MSVAGAPRRPRVSILLPVRDAVATLPVALASVQRQTWIDWECVVVDDGSVDGSRVHVARTIDGDARMRWIDRPARGIAAALNAGLDACRGELIARMDADDVMHRERLAVQVAAIERQALDGVGCHVRLFPSRDVGHGMREYAEWLNGIRCDADVKRDALVECPLAHPTWTFSRECFDGGYRHFDGPEDYELLLRILSRGLRIGTVARRLLAWRRGRVRSSVVDPRYAQERFIEVKAEHLVRGFLAGVERYVLWGYGDTGRALCRALRARGRLPDHVIEVHPGRIGQTIGGAPVVRPEALRVLPRRPIVVSVARARPRSEVRRALDAMGFVELRDYVCAA